MKLSDLLGAVTGAVSIAGRIYSKLCMLVNHFFLGLARLMTFETMFAARAVDNIINFTRLAPFGSLKSPAITHTTPTAAKIIDIKLLFIFMSGRGIIFIKLFSRSLISFPIQLYYTPIIISRL